MAARSTRLAVLAAGLLAVTGAAQAEPATAAVAAPTHERLHGVPALRERIVPAVASATLANAGPAGDPGAIAPAVGMDNPVRTAIGCTVAGTVATAAAFAAGGENTLNLVAGGLVPSVNRGALYVGLVGVVFGSFCAIGASLTPIVVHALAAPQDAPPAAPIPARHAGADGAIPQHVAVRSGVLGDALAGAVRRIGASAIANVPPAVARDAPPVLLARQP